MTMTITQTSELLLFFIKVFFFLFELVLKETNALVLDKVVKLLFYVNSEKPASIRLIHVSL